MVKKNKNDDSDFYEGEASDNDLYESEEFHDELYEDEEEDKKIPLTKEDIALGKNKMKALIKGTKKYAALYGGATFLDALANISVTFASQNEKGFNYGWFYTYIASKVVSGASNIVLENLVYQKYQKKSIAIQNQLQKEYDHFSISERQNRSPDDVIYDITQMQLACNQYWSARSNLIAQVAATSFLFATTLYSQMANLPIMAAAATSSAVVSYFMNKELSQHKIKDKEVIRKKGSRLNKKNREMIATSVERGLSDPRKNENIRQHIRQHKFLEAFKMFTKRLHNYALTGTAIKTAIIGGVVAATYIYTNPANMLVASTAAFLMHHSIDRLWSSRFSLKEHCGSFSNAYRSFKPKIYDISFGKEKIPQKANVIMLDKIVFRHRQEKDITQKGDKDLFANDTTVRIGPGITFLSGASGAGKSTLLDLLKHSDDVTSGRILIGTEDTNGQFMGIDYKDLAFNEPSRHIAFDSQKSELNETTVASFLTRANPKASPELVQKVKELVGINQNEQEGLTDDTRITKKLSGGEISRLKLAQTLIKDSPILVLDEVTTGIDTATKDRIIDYINQLKNEKTIIWVTHMPDEIEKLEAYQAIDLTKNDQDSPATFNLYDMTDNKTKQEYIEFFKTRTISPSDKIDYNTASELDLDRIIHEATQKADNYDKKAAEQRRMIQQAQSALERIRNIKGNINTNNNQPTNAASSENSSFNASSNYTSRDEY